jgi:uncharacterized repeat protein (TIGR01451 family)
MSAFLPHRRARCQLLAVLIVVSCGAAQADTTSAVPLGAAGVSVTQDFDTLVSTGTGTLAGNTPAGWGFVETGTNANTSYTAGTGSSNTGDTFSFGSAGNSDRAFGGLQSGSLVPTLGARFVNNTGATITSLQVAYTGEQWRLGATGRADRIDFQYSTDATSLASGTWTDVNTLDFSSPITTGTAGALDGNAAANRTAISATITGLAIAAGAEFYIRWIDFNATGADDGLSVDDFSLTPDAGGPVTPTLSINDVAVTEGNSGGTTATFTVSLTAPAGVGGVTFDIATANGTATTANNDYVASSLTGQTIPAGSSTYSFNVTVNGDPTPEPNETYFVNVTNITGANAGDAQGLGTITNDDVTITPIHDIQGPGASSPIVGASVTTRGIVTGVRSNGFFIQTPDAEVDADPATSQGLAVFTSSAPPAAAVVGALVQVTATVAEFVPSQDPLQPPVTQLTGSTVVQVSTGNPLPAAVTLTTTFPDPAGPHDQLERLEGMRVSLPSLTVTGPTLGSINEANATATSTGVFYGTATGIARPFREPGIQAPDPTPAGTIPPIPRWDANPELIRVDSDGLVGGPLIDVGTGAVVTGLVGPLDYAFRRYTILPDPSAPPATGGGPTATATTAPTASEVTIASWNLERLFDDVNDPAIGEPVLTTAAFNNRLAKASRAIRDFLRTPDIVGIQEAENLSTLQALATRINNDAVAAAQPNPQYQAYLVEGNDVGGIDVGFLVKTAQVVGTTPRVSVTAVTQVGATTTITNPDSSTELLNDRPPLVLEAVVNAANGASFPVTVVVNHLRSLNDVASVAPGSNGWPTSGERVRNKRKLQAEFLANLVQTRQAASASERIVVLGDLNAFEFNDGFVDSVPTIAGTPTPDNNTAVPGDGIDLVNPDLVNVSAAMPAAARYSFVFDGNAQFLDHILVNEDVVTATVARRVEAPRIGADFAETARNNTSDAVRLSDHDPLVLYLDVSAFGDTAPTVAATTPANAATNVAVASNLSVSFSEAVNVSGNWFTIACAVSGNRNVTDTVVTGGPTTFTINPNVDFAPGETCTWTLVATNITDQDALDPPDTMAANVVVNYTTADTAPTVTATTPANAATNVALASNLSVTFSEPVNVIGNWFTIACAVSGNRNVADTVVSGGPTTFTINPNVDFAVGEACTWTLIAANITDQDTIDPPDTMAANVVVGYTTADTAPTVTATTPTNGATAVARDANLTVTFNEPVNVTGNWFTIACTVSGNRNVADTVVSGGPTTFTINPNADFAPAEACTLTVIAAQVTDVDAVDPPDAMAANVVIGYTTASSAATLSATKRVAGGFVPGGTLVYTVRITNAGPSTQLDNPGAEMTDVLPPELDLVSATATAGTATATVASRTVTWNGSLAAGASVDVVITARINTLGAPGTRIANQATLAFDADGNGTNEASAVSDDPTTGTPGDATAGVVARIEPVPVDARWALLLLFAGVLLLAAGQQRRMTRTR